MPDCSSGTLTNVLQHWNAMSQTQDVIPNPVTVYRYGADLSLCYPLMWDVTLEYRTTHFHVLCQTRSGNTFPTSHTHQLNCMICCYGGPCRVGSVGSVSASRTVGREFASRPGHTKDHHKNGTNCLPA